jgi:hypothetical protein
MVRFTLLITSFICCSTANGFPAPTPTEQPTPSEMILGTWQVTKIAGNAPANPLFCEFRRDGTMRAFGQPGGPDDHQHRLYYYSIANRQLAFGDEPGKMIISRKIDILTVKKMVAEEFELGRR